MTTEEINKHAFIIELNEILDSARQTANQNRKYTVRIANLTVIFRDTLVPERVLILCLKDEKYYEFQTVDRPEDGTDVRNLHNSIIAQFAARGLDYPFRKLKEYIEIDLL